MMMKDDDRKKIAILISGKGKPDKLKGADTISDNKLAMLSAAEEVLSAIRAEDAEMLLHSVCALVDMHQEYKEEMSEDEY